MIGNPLPTSLGNPYYGTRCQGRQAVGAATVGQYSRALVRPGATVCLEVVAFSVDNESGAATSVGAGFGSFAQLPGTLGGATTLYVPSKKPVGTQNAPGGSYAQSGVDANATLGNTTILSAIMLANNENKIITLPQSIFLYGDDSGGVPYFEVRIRATNLALNPVVFYCREWTLPVPPYFEGLSQRT